MNRKICNSALLKFFFKKLPDFPSKNCKINSNKIFERYCIKIKYMVCCVVNWFSHSPLRMDYGVHACKCLKSCCNVVAPSERAQVPAFRPFFKKRQLYIFWREQNTIPERLFIKIDLRSIFNKSKHKRFPFFRSEICLEIR